MIDVIGYVFEVVVELVVYCGIDFIGNVECIEGFVEGVVVMV